MIAVYVMLSTGTIHLTEDVVLLHTRHAQTLCGRPIRNAEIGDETHSGLAATCRTCKRLMSDKLAS